MDSRFEHLNVDSIEYDTDNPRIKKALEKYADKITAERIHFALRSASEGTNATESFLRLRDSIHACGGITQPITVVVQGDSTTCIDGNTRLAIYKEFSKQGTKGNWGKISALVLENTKKVDVETIRVSAHLVGPRAWPAYEKARYLHYLYHTEFMEFDKMIALCGGNRSEIERQIDAYEDMNEYYRDVVDDSAFHIDRFSGFVELQKPGVKEAIFDANFDLENFGEWIRDGNIRRLMDVRKLPRVFQDDEAKDIFSNGGIGSIELAMKHVERKMENALKPSTGDLADEETSVHMIAQTLVRRLSNMPFSTLRGLQEGKSNENIQTLQTLEDLSECLNEVLASVRKS